MIQYLFGRGIDYQLIQECIADGTLYESANYHNVVFIGKDESGTPKYAALRSTLGSTFKQDASGSDKRIFRTGIPQRPQSNFLSVIHGSSLQRWRSNK